MNIGIIGGGIIGLTSGVVLAEAGHDVQIYSKHRFEEMTSWAAGATCSPFVVEESERVDGWVRANIDVLAELVDIEGAGVSWQAWKKFSRQSVMPEDYRMKYVRNLRNLEAGEFSEPYSSGCGGELLLMHVDFYYPYLLRRFEEAGGKLLMREVEISELAEAHDIVVNAAGIFADDEDLMPVRGQIVVVRNPGVHELFNDTEEPNYIFPRGDECVLGGSTDEGDWSMEVDDSLTARIIENTTRMEPRLKGAEVLSVRVGLRPLRPTVRVEREVLVDGTPVIHNYGHGGAGYTLSWGCARDVLKLVESA